MIHRAFLVACGALVAAACTIEKSDKAEDEGGTGGTSSSGGAVSSGGASSGGASAGGSSSGGRSAGGAGSGGDATGGMDAGPDGDAGGDADATATPDASDGAVDPFADGGACAPDPGDGGDDACAACVKASCCTEWLGCNDDACAGDDASDRGEFIRFQTCVSTALQSDAGAASVGTCAASSALTGGVLATSTRELVACMVASTVTLGRQRCSEECFGGVLQP